jgi:hypothetical protein
VLPQNLSGFDIDLTRWHRGGCHADGDMKTHLHGLPAILAAIVLLAAPKSASAQAAAPAPPAADPFARDTAAPPQKTEEAYSPRVISICYEVFSLPLEDAAKLRRTKPTDPKLYEEIVARTAKGTAEQEYFALLRARSGEKAVLESVSEQIHPTEYDHGGKPEEAPQAPDAETQGNAKPAPAAARPAPPSSPAPALPVAFETRNTGFNLEIEPTLSEGDIFVDLRIAPEFVTMTDRSKWGQGSSTAEMPEFETQRINTATTARVGQPVLLATPSRPPVSKVDKDSAKRIWFAFVTADVMKP